MIKLNKLTVSINADGIQQSEVSKKYIDEIKALSNTPEWKAYLDNINSQFGNKEGGGSPKKGK